MMSVDISITITITEIIHIRKKVFKARMISIDKGYLHHHLHNHHHHEHHKDNPDEEEGVEGEDD